MYRILLAGAASLALCEAANACSVLPDIRPYAERIASLQEARLAPLIRDAAFIEIAIPIAHYPQAALDERDLRRMPHTFRFVVVEQLKGQGPSSFEAQLANGDYTAPPDDARHPWMTNRLATPYQTVFSTWFWDAGRAPEPGFIIGGNGDCADGYTFVLDLDYLVIRNEAGQILSAHPFNSPTDEWVIAVRTALASPEVDFPWSRPLREHLRHQPWGGEVLTVEDCTRPVTRSAGLFSSDRSRDWVDDGIPPDIESFQDTQQQSPSQRLSEETDAELTERLRADWAYFDSTRYQRFPFDRDTCQVGARYLRLLTHQLFPISDDEIVDFTGYASQMRLTGDMQISLSEVMTLMSEVSGGN
ncbi:MAG: hypothetical protein JJ884_04085 [Maricaulis sp.]|uniref:hypothetical protein n=1 Tax=Maricaulis sp. TaxID=1486257 RepID=UPI001B07D015|nr:hypothetical protein [Maricaulis sp.]MBO6728360.1 hypothetical protein [Maricaulis sp.]MBO6846676.1 hypothetical protein [Maricaulis sp.]MBO6877740.1 hypothetical protein [Maricaulis sp.]